MRISAGAFTAYEALRARLEQGRFGSDEHSDMLAPVIKLNPLSYEEMLVLTEKLADIHAELFGYERTLGQEGLIAFIKIEYGRIGADKKYYPARGHPRLYRLLNISFQNPD